MSNTKIIDQFISKIQKVFDEVDEDMEKILRKTLLDTLNEFSISFESKEIEKKTDKKVLKMKTPTDSSTEKITFSNFSIEELLKQTVPNLKNLAKNYNLVISSKEKKNEIIAKLKNISVSEVDEIVEAEKMKKEKKVIKKPSEIVPDVIAKYKQGRVTTIRSPFGNCLYPNTKFVIGKSAKIIGKENDEGKVVKLTNEDVDFVKENFKVNIESEAILEDFSINQIIDVAAVQKETEEEENIAIKPIENPLKTTNIFIDDSDLDEEN